MKKKFTFALAATVLMLCSLQKTNAQAWAIGGNNVPKDTTLGTRNAFALRFITNNVERGRITNTGRLGIGTTAPASAFHVVGTQTLAGNLNFTSGSQSIQFANPGAGTAAMMYMLASGTANPNRMVLAHSTALPANNSGRRTQFPFGTRQSR